MFVRGIKVLRMLYGYMSECRRKICFRITGGLRAGGLIHYGKNTGIDPLKERDGEFSWENQSGTSIISEYNEKNVYKPDDELYAYYHQVFEDSMPYIREIISLYDSEEKEKLYTWISRNREQIREIF